MFCKNCGKQMKDGAVFCMYCGTKIMSVGQSQSQTEVSQYDSDNRTLMIPIIIVAVCILAVTGGIFYALHRDNKTNEKLAVEGEINDVEPEQIDTHYDFSVEDVEQDIVSDISETGIGQQEDVESEKVEEKTSQYILPDSDSKYLTKLDLYELTQEECRLARNELYARYGRLFDDEGLQNYFNSKDWYRGHISPSDFSEAILNEYETANRDLIVQYEEEMGYR